MKCFFIFLPLLLFVLPNSDYLSNPNDISSEENRIEVIFKPQVSFNDLVKIKLDLANHGITIQYRKIVYNEEDLLTQLSIGVDCNDGFSGSATTNDLSESNGFGFFRDYRTDCDYLFLIGELNDAKNR